MRVLFSMDGHANFMKEEVTIMHITVLSLQLFYKYLFVFVTVSLALVRVIRYFRDLLLASIFAFFCLLILFFP